MKPSNEFKRTQEDKDRYEKRISEIDLNDIPMVLKEIPQKIEKLTSKLTSKPTSKLPCIRLSSNPSQITCYLQKASFSLRKTLLFHVSGPE